MIPKTVLYVEDEENDVLLLQLGFEKAGINHRLQIVGDGQEAVAYLSGSGQYANREQYPSPTLVLLDLNLPCLTGMKVLQWIREQPQFATLPVVMYTSSDHPRDLENARQLGVTEYVLKPSRIGKIAELLQRLSAQWLSAPSVPDPKTQSALQSAAS
jgi:CheY-like chemotaxis protein